ncbi:hypothetical protein [Thalassotalea sp. G20_0]|nr:hypothetical protein [Thalassotalea sp. G20_0]
MVEAAIPGRNQRLPENTVRTIKAVMAAANGWLNSQNRHPSTAFR